MEESHTFFFLISLTCVHLDAGVAGIIQVELGAPGFVDIATGSVALSFTGPAFELAIEQVNQRYAGIFNFSIEYLYEDGGNATSVVEHGTNLIVEWYYRKRKFSDGLAVILSPGTLDYGQVHQLAAEWDILYFQTVLFAKSGYTLPAAPILATSATSPPAIIRTFISVLKRNRWSTVFTVVDTVASPFFFLVVFLELELYFKENPAGFSVYQKRISSVDYEGDSKSYGPLLDEFKDLSRVMIVFARPDHLRRLLIDASSRNMTNGEYVYLCFGTHPSLPAPRFGNLSWQYGDSFERDEMAKTAFSSLIVVQEYKDPITVDVDKFLAEVRHRGQGEFGQIYQQKDQTIHDVLACFATITMLAQVLNESLVSEGEAFLHDARRLAQRFLRRNFRNGFSEMFLDWGGDRASTQAVAHFTGTDPHREIFLLEQKENNYKFQEIANISDSWPGKKWPPLNEPICGYKNDKSACDKTNQIAMTSGLAILGLAAVLLLAVRITVISLRYRDMDIWWRLTEGDLDSPHNQRGRLLSLALHGTVLSLQENRDMWKQLQDEQGRNKLTHLHDPKSSLHDSRRRSSPSYLPVIGCPACPC